MAEVPAALSSQGTPAMTGRSRYDCVETRDGRRSVADRRGVRALPSRLPAGSDLRRLADLTSQTGGDRSRLFPSSSRARRSCQPKHERWTTNREGMERLTQRRRLIGRRKDPALRTYPRTDFPASPGYEHLDGHWAVRVRTDTRSTSSRRSDVVIERCLLMTTDPGDLVLDPTCGSRHHRLRRRAVGPPLDHHRHQPRGAGPGPHAPDGRAEYPYYLLADSPERPIAGKEAEAIDAATSRARAAITRLPRGDDPQGLRLQARAPRHARSRIAKNPTSSEGHDAAARDRRRHRPPRRDRDCSTTSPTRTTSASASRPVHRREPVAPPRAVDRRRAAGLRGDGQRAEARPGRLRHDDPRQPAQGRRPEHASRTSGSSFDRLDPYAGDWLHATGEYTDADGKRRARGRLHRPRARHRRPAAGQGSRQGSGPGRRLRPAGRLRLRLRPARVAKRRKRYGKLTVLPARMNPDLAMGDELLKKTGAGNLFMVFGEPDVDDPTSRRTASSSSRSRAWTSTTRPPAQIRSTRHRRHRLLVHRHRLQRRELLRPPRLLHRRRRALRQAASAPCGPRSTRPPGPALYSHRQPALPAAARRARSP